jgi:hypothetical protein
VEGGGRLVAEAPHRIVAGRRLGALRVADRDPPGDVLERDAALLDGLEQNEELLLRRPSGEVLAVEAPSVTPRSSTALSRMRNCSSGGRAARSSRSRPVRSMRTAA